MQTNKSYWLLHTKIPMKKITNTDFIFYKPGNNSLSCHFCMKLINITELDSLASRDVHFLPTLGELNDKDEKDNI